MASGCLAVWFADEILGKLYSLEAMQDEQLVLPPDLKNELQKVKNTVSAVKAAFVDAERRQRDKGLAASAFLGGIYFLELFSYEIDKWVNTLISLVRERSTEVVPMLWRNIMKIKRRREKLEVHGRRFFCRFDEILNQINSGKEISVIIDSFGSDTEGEIYGNDEDKEKVVQSLIPSYFSSSLRKLLETTARRLLFQNGDVPNALAIKILTNIFYFKYSLFLWPFDFWFDAAKLFDIVVPESILVHCSPTLLQSYAKLPLHLKYCFDYCSLFSRDYEIDVQMLVNLWMAQGFIITPPPDSNRCLEDVGREYLVELLKGGFFQEVESDIMLDDENKVSKCKMDRDAFSLSALASGTGYLLLCGDNKDNKRDNKNFIGRTFHLSFDFHLYSQRQIPRDMIEDASEFVLSVLCPSQLRLKTERGMIDLKKIRDIISPDQDSGRKHKEGIEQPESVSSLIISKFKGLRALELHDFEIQRLPDYIDKLEHLRYLDLSRNADIKLLPDSITKLVNLQTLKLSSCFGLEELPKDIKSLINLRHLEIDGCYNLKYMPPYLGKLTNLHTLSQFVLNNDANSADDPNYCSQLKELESLNSLRGDLQIKNLSLRVLKDDASKTGCLGEKQHLQSLTLDWGVGEEGSDQYKSQLEALKPHQNLKGLTLNAYGGVVLSSWLVPDNHVQLVKLTLRRCPKFKVVPNAKLPSLKSLTVDDMAGLEYLSEHYFEELFPSLQELWLTELPELKGWWKDEVHGKPSFRFLSQLFIQDCPKLALMPFYPTLDEELVLDTTRLVTFQQMMTKKETLASPPLSKLKKLSLVGMQELTDAIADEIQWEALTSLSVLKLDFLPKLEKLPSRLRRLTNLKELHIWRCQMEALPEWIEDLKSLEKLAIWTCPKLKSLPQGIRSLTSLQTLEIEDSTTLLLRCQKEIGADWENIKDIPDRRLAQLSPKK